MARKPAPKNDPLSEARARIREAEKRHRPVLREHVQLDQTALDTLVLLVERGVGKKQDVLREAMATGLRVMKAGSDGTETSLASEYALPIGDREAEVPAHPLIAAAMGHAPTSAPVTIPPSQLRHEDDDEVQPEIPEFLQE